MKNKRGITLVALVITIILMLMLAGVVVTNVRDGGLFNKAKTATQNTEDLEEKMAIQQAIAIASATSINGKITEEDFQNAIDGQLGVTGKAIVSQEGDTFAIGFPDTNNYYALDGNGNVIDYTYYVDETPGAFAGSGTQDNPYKIECIEDLIYLSLSMKRN